MKDDAETRAGGSRLGGAGFWTVAAFAALTVVAAASQSARAGLFWVLSLPMRAVGWALPGADATAAARFAGDAVGWIGWALLAGLWAPLLLVAVGLLLKLAPALDRLGDAWTSAVRGRSGVSAATAAWAGAVAPGLAAIVFSALGYLPAWSTGPAILVSSALTAPVLMRTSEHPVVALSRLTVRVVEVAGRLFGDGARWASLALVLVIVVTLIQRFFFARFDVRLDELVVYLYAAMFLLIASAALKADVHVRLSVFYGGLSPRRRAFVNFLGVYLLLTPLCLAVLATSEPYAALVWRVQSPAGGGMPVGFLLRVVVPGTAALVLAQAAAVAAQEALVLTGVDADGEAAA